jgi:hypothetical protein
MMGAQQMGVKLSFPFGWDDRTAFDAKDRGVMDCVHVELPNGKKVQVGFYDPIRLAQDLDSSKASGTSWIAIPGMIVIPEVTVELMQKAVDGLFHQGYFDHVVPI